MQSATRNATDPPSAPYQPKVVRQEPNVCHSVAQSDHRCIQVSQAKYARKTVSSKPFLRRLNVQSQDQAALTMPALSGDARGAKPVGERQPCAANPLKFAIRWCSAVLCVCGHRVGAASSVCYACHGHWRGMRRPKPTQPQPGDDSPVTSSGGREPARHVGPPPPPRWRADNVERYWDGRV